VSAVTNTGAGSLTSVDGVGGEGSFSMSRAGTSEEDDDDLTPIEYAARYGLITREPVWSATGPWDIRSMLSVTLAGLEPADSISETNELLAELMVAHHALNKPERWDIDSSVARFMTTTFSMQTQTMLDDICRQDARRSLSMLKLEPRILSTDPEADLAALRARNRLSTSLQEIGHLGLKGRKVQLDAWSPDILMAPSKVKMLLEGERKLDVDSVAVTYLNDICRPEQTPEVQFDLASLDSSIVSRMRSRSFDVTKHA